MRATPEGTWIPALPLADLKVGDAHVFKQAGKQVAIFRLAEDQLHAVDNRCPHEGYPLAQGYVKGCLLTCAWHNFKFDLRDGACVMGDEAVRTFPIRVREGLIELDLTDPDPSSQIPGLLASLEEGLQEYQLGRCARDVARLLHLGVPATRLAAEAALYDARYGEYGSTHGLPVASDVATRYLPRHPGLSATLPLMQAFDAAARGAIRRAARPIPAPVDPGPDPASAGARLRALVEAEDTEGAQALLRGALARGWGREVVEPWSFRLVADHFLDYGHALIYLIKAWDLLDAAGFEHAEPILVSHLYSIACGTREDTLPKWAGWQARRMALRPALPALYAQRGQAPFTAAGRQVFLSAVVDGRGQAAFEAVVEAIEGGVALSSVADALVLAASERLLRFDVAYDADPAVQNDWLDITHILTFADALCAAVKRWDDPGIIELLLQGARMVNHTRPLDMPAGSRFSLAPAAAIPADLPAALIDAIDRRSTAEALSLAAAWHARGEDPAPLRAALQDRAISDPATRPIFVAHHIKTTVAAFDRYEALTGDPAQGLPLLAAVRFLASPAVERRMMRSVHEAVQLISEGRTPRTLTG